MAKLKSFEQYVSEMDRSEEIEKDTVDMGVPDNKDIEEVEDDAEEVQANESEEMDLDGEDADSEENNVPVSEMLESCYSKVKEEAKVWESDAYDDHTVETYMIENAALVASLAANALSEMKEDMSGEAYDACLNQMVEAYTKKCNEYKESYGTPDAEAEDIE